MHPLPNSARRIKYLEINGDGAYINTGVVPQNNPSAVIRAQYLGTSQTSAQTTPLFGRRDYSSPYMLFAFWVRSDTLKMAVNWGTYDTGWQSKTIDKTAFHNYELKSSGGYFDGSNFVSVADGGSITAWSGTPIYIGAVNQSNAIDTIVTRGVKLRIASFQLWNNSGADLVYDGVPVRVGQTGYLFDRVSGQLFGNAGTGNFVLGPDIPQGVVPSRLNPLGVRKRPYDAEVEWLQASALSTSSGPYVDTGFIPTSYSRFELEYANMGTPSSQEVMNGVAGGAGGSNNSRFAIGTSTNGRGSTYFGVVQSNIDSVQRVYSQTKIFQFIYLNGTSATYGTDSVTRTVTINAYGNTTAPVILFARYGGSGVFFPGATTQRIYWCKLWRDSTTLAHHFIPVRKGTTGYLYDKVTKQLFGNAGTGAFTIGPDK